YLVCTTAKVGAGCSYKGARYADVESAIVDRAEEIVAECPAGTPAGDAMEAELRHLDASGDHIRDELEALLLTAGHLDKTSPALAARIAEKEAELGAIKDRAEQVSAQHSALTLPSRRSRLDDFLAATRSDTLDRRAVNVALRTLMTGVVVD